MEARLLPCGERAVLVEVDGLPSVLALRAVLADRVDAARRAHTGPDAPDEHGWDRVVDVVPAARTVLVTVDEPATLDRLRAALTDVVEALPDAAADRPGQPGSGEDVVEVPVRYDGPDLSEVAGLTGLTTDEVVRAHTGSPWTVAFGGFAPGFAYLVGGDERLAVPRRERPRPRIEPGSVGLAGEYSGVYPSASPGGWQLLGRTALRVWDPDRYPPALLQPGRTVRFVAVGDT